MGTDEVYKQIKSIETGDYVVFAQTHVRRHFIKTKSKICNLFAYLRICSIFVAQIKTTTQC